jgi:hypothetical protein
MYVVSVASECFKNRSCVASPSLPSAASPRCLLLLPASARHPLPPPSLLGADDVGVARPPCGQCGKSTVGAGDQTRTVCPDVGR